MTNVVVLINKSHRFIFLWKDGEQEALLQQVEQLADDPELPEFGWAAACVVKRKVLNSDSALVSRQP